MSVNNSQNMEKKYKIGIDLGGTNIKVGIVNEANEIVSMHSVPTLVERGYVEIINDMEKCINITLKNINANISHCSVIGVGSPGTVDFITGSIVYANNLFWEDVPLGAILSEKTGLPVKVSNDANCAALGECVAGSAKNYESAVLLTLGTGVGGGVVYNNQVFEGFGPGAMELGHTTLINGGIPCTCGRKGCLESYASATALIQHAIKACEENPETVMIEMCAGNLSNMNGLIPFNACKDNDEVAKKVIKEYIDNLSEGIINMANIFRPDVVLLSGGICGQGEYLTAPIKEYIKKGIYGGKTSKVPQIEIASLGNNAGIIGAANL